MWTLALSAARAHRAAQSGTALTLATAGAVLSLVGVLLESGLRGGPGVDGAMLTTLASSYAGTALVVVLLVVTATVALALRGRRRELALLRTVGATSGQVRGQVAREVLLVASVAVPVGSVPGLVLATRLEPLLRDAGILRTGTGLVLSPLPTLAAVAVLLPSALLAGRLATRETLRTAPTDALRAAAVESAGIGPVRRALALLAGVAGLAAAASPVVVPGTIGGATAASSAFLLVGAAALGGPLLVGRAFAHAARRPGDRTDPATFLAVHNVRGFSRRLTTVVVPLAVALATGTVQTSVDAAIGEAGRDQLRAAVRGDLVVTGGRRDQVAGVSSAPGVSAVVPVTDVPLQVRTDEDDLPDSLVWEAATLRVVPPDAPTTVFDPDVTRGRLSALDGPGTVAVSSDAAFELGLGLGDPVDVRADGTEHRLHVVAVFDRGLGVGGYLAGPATARLLGTTPAGTTTLVDASGPVGTTAAGLRARGLTVSTAAEYADSATSADAATQHLSTVLLLLLLVFVVLGAATALVLTTAGRRAELVLLNRTGTTRRQLLRMTLVESLLTGGLAWAVGTVAVGPAVLGVSLGLLGPHVPVVDLATYAVLTSVVVVTAVIGTVAPAVLVLRRAGRVG